MPGFSSCPCLRPQDEEVHVLDYRHCSLDFLPSDVFAYERTLEELYVDANQIRDLPRELFYCHGLRKLSCSDNEIIAIAPAIASLINLEHLDISKNGIIDLPENIKQCKSLLIIEASVNPLGKLPEGFTQLLNLTELYLNDTFLDYLPGSFGRLSKLKILEIRENHLKTLPKSLSRLTQLERLDIGNNDFTELPEVLGLLVSLLEFWCDTNKLTALPHCLGNLKQLMYFDASKNRIEALPQEIEGCISLADLHLSTNLLQSLPESIGRLSNLTTCKVDDNRLNALPFSIGGLVSLSELNISGNDLEEIPPSIGLLRHLRTLYADENFLVDVPPELGSCSGLTVLSLRSNNLTYIPDELGRIPRLRVFNLSDNKLKSLPYSLTRLKEIQALWLAENQTKPLVKLQSDVDPDTGQRVLTCYLLPQQAREDREDMNSDNNSFHPSMWEEERLQRQQIKFDFGELDEHALGRLERTPTPYPKEMKQRIQHMRNLALKELNVPNGEVQGGGNNPAAFKAMKANGEPPRVEGRGSPNKNTNYMKAQHRSTEDIEAGVREAHGLVKYSSTSPLAGERHLLLRADKEKTQKDKARIKQHRNSADSMDNMDGKSLKSTESLSKGKSKGKTSSRTEIHKGDDGGFLDPSSKRSSQHSPASVHRSKTYPENPHGVVSNDPHYGHRQQGYTHPESGAIPPDAVPANQITLHQQHNGEVPRTYEDFMRDLQSRSGLHQMWRDSNNLPKRPSSYHSSHSHRHHRSRKSQSRGGYESDAGYRSEGVQSEIIYTRKHQTLPGGRDGGYSSDWDTQKHHKSSRGGGYASDVEHYSSRHQSNYGYHPVGVQNVYNGNTNQNYNHSSSMGMLHQQPKVSNQKQIQIPQSSYSNMPYTARTTIRNDEMYQQNKKKNKKQSAASSSVKDGSNFNSGNDTNSRTLENNNYESHGSHPQTQQQQRDEQNKTPSSVSDYEDHQRFRNREERHSIREAAIKEEGSSDDDQYRAQLYQASVRLQKSPSDPHKRMQNAKRQQSPSKANSSTATLSSNTATATNSRVTPPYPEAPPYSPPKQTGNVASTSNTPTKHIDSPRSQSSSSQGQSQASPRDNLLYAASTDRSQQHNMNNNQQSDSKSSTLPATSNSGIYSSYSMTPPGKQGASSQLSNNVRSKTLTDVSRSSESMSLKDNNRSHRSDLDIRYEIGNEQSKTQTPVKNNAQYNHSNQSSNVSVSQPKQLEPSYQSNTSAHLYSSPSNKSFGTPHRLSNYEKDVAVFKGKEPTSQVSSSTDSGYVHGHSSTLDRLSNDFKLSGNYGTPHKVSPVNRSLNAGSSPAKAHSSPQNNTSSPTTTPRKMEVTIVKNPGLGFSIAGGLGSPGNPYRPGDVGIFITKVQADGPAAMTLQPGDKILQVNGIDFQQIEHRKAVETLRNTGSTVQMVTERW